MFKFFGYGEQDADYGDNEADGNAEPAGNDIALALGRGTYEITFNDRDLTYSITKLANVAPTTAPAEVAAAKVNICLGSSICSIMSLVLAYCLFVSAQFALALPTWVLVSAQFWLKP